MNRRVGIILIVGMGVLGFGIILTGVAKFRLAQAKAYCENNLRQLGEFAAVEIRLPDPKTPDKIPEPTRTAIPAGTIPNPALPPDSRLSWAVESLPFRNQKQSDSGSILGAIDRTASWDAEPNRPPSLQRIPAFTCYGNLPPVVPDQPAPIQYLGIAGINPDAATLELGPPVPPRAGCFRYDAPTPYDAIADGISQTILFAETNRDLGPWIRGGPSTVRGLDVTPESPMFLGVGGQFGGNHPGGANLGFVDGSVRFLTDRISPEVFKRMVTIAGGDELYDEER